MTEARRIPFIILSTVAFCVFGLGVFFINYIVSLPFSSQESISSSYILDDLSVLSLDPLVTYIPAELRGESDNPVILDTDPRKGLSGAKVELVFFSDLISDDSAAAYAVVKEVFDKNSTLLSLVWKDFPIPRIYGSSLVAAQSARCAQEQGEDSAFWQMTDEIMKNRSNFSKDAAIGLASSLGLDQEKFLTCLDSQSVLSKIQRSYLAAKYLGLSSPPALYIGNSLYQGKFDYNSILEEINKAMNNVSE